MAALKKLHWLFFYNLPRGSPRRHCRGRIEELGLSANLPELADVLHGVTAVAALKIDYCDVWTEKHRKFSTASLPWPH